MTSPVVFSQVKMRNDSPSSQPKLPTGITHETLWAKTSLLTTQERSGVASIQTSSSEWGNHRDFQPDHSPYWKK